MSDIRDSLISSVEHTKELIEEEGLDGIDPLDIKATVDLSGNISNITIVTGTGGPHVEIDLHRNVVIGYWGEKEVIRPLDDNSAQMLWDYYHTSFEGIIHA